VEGMLSHQLEQNRIDGEKTIIQVNILILFSSENIILLCRVSCGKEASVTLVSSVADPKTELESFESGVESGVFN
jgi:hypothetical protein